jgi:hypothetical protein
VLTKSARHGPVGIVSHVNFPSLFEDTWRFVLAGFVAKLPVELQLLVPLFDVRGPAPDLGGQSQSSVERKGSNQKSEPHFQDVTLRGRNERQCWPFSQLACLNTEYS